MDSSCRRKSIILPSCITVDICNSISRFIYRWKSGVASSLNYVKISDEKSPVLHPYPSWQANQLPAVAHASNEQDNYGGGRTDAKAAEKADENFLEKNNETIISTFRIRV